MSWMQRLYDTYAQALNMDGASDEQVMPISHTLQNAHINIVIDGEGNFIRAKVLKKTQIVLPATESSASRGNGDFPHPLADKLQYVAKDYAEYGGKKNAYFPSYQAQLKQWCESDYSHPQAQAVLKYIDKGQVIADLIAHKIVHIDADNQLLSSWDNKEAGTPELFTTLPKEQGNTEQGSALVCWTVERAGDMDVDTWKNPELQRSWIEFEASNSAQTGLCFISGEEIPLASNHPAKLRHTGDKAKLISSNDESGFTFRGRFTAGEQAAGIGFDVTQKAHNALRWLITRQGFKNSDQVIIAWALSNKPIPNPVDDPYGYLDDDEELSEEVATNITVDESSDNTLSHDENLGARFTNKLKLKMKGYQQTLEAHEQISIMALDSATPGRMSVTYYRECLQQDYFEALETWYSDFAWFQRHTKEIPVEGRKPKHKVIWPVISPSPLSIAQATFGQRLTDALKKQVYARVLPCITEKANIPLDILNQCVRQASNPAGLDEWEWERNVGVACALYRGFYLRHPNLNERRNFTMALDTTITSRDYLYGRLLAVAERMESIALSVAGEKRRTTAERFMQQFSERPFSTWRNIELALDPYKARLRNSRAGFLHNREEEITDIVNLFAPNDFCNDSKLSGEFLLGYHCQKMNYRKNKEEQNEVPTETTESVN